MSTRSHEPGRMAQLKLAVFSNGANKAREFPNRAHVTGAKSQNLLESGEERMKSLLIQARELPRQLAVFGWFCTRLSIPNFGWAPTSLSDVLWPGDPDDPRKAVCTEDGLFGEFTVVRFDPVTFWEPFGIILIVKENDVTAITVNHDRPSGNLGGNYTVSVDVVCKEWLKSGLVEGVNYTDYIRIREGYDTGPPSTSQSEAGSRVFNLVLSPYFFRIPEAKQLTVGGFLMKGKALEESMREEGVGAMVFPSELHQVPHPVDERPSLACKFVAPASVRFGLPDRVETSRTRRGLRRRTSRTMGASAHEFPKFWRGSESASEVIHDQANVIVACEFAMRYGDKGIVSTSVHPVLTQSYFQYPASQGALISLYAATAPEALNANGKYLCDLISVSSSPRLSR
ncbi:hypothetical protein B0H11DRAFT_1901760 [Mycena galericulata]|nr:hypothetical protein B0H11DRAFT_1901760 [Mycena galericulata]